MRGCCRPSEVSRGSAPVERVTGILETVSLSPRGITLAELAAALGAAKTSIQELNQRTSRAATHRGSAPVPPGSGPFIMASRSRTSC